MINFPCFPHLRKWNRHEADFWCHSIVHGLMWFGSNFRVTSKKSAKRQSCVIMAEVIQSVNWLIKRWLKLCKTLRHEGLGNWSLIGSLLEGKNKLESFVWFLMIGYDRAGFNKATLWFSLWFLLAKRFAHLLQLQNDKSWRIFWIIFIINVSKNSSERTHKS